MAKPTSFLVATDIVVIAVGESGVGGVASVAGSSGWGGASGAAGGAGAAGDVDAAGDVNAFEGSSVLLITRKNEPYRGQYALPGGFVDPGEVTRAAALRELAEETSLGSPELEPLLEQVGAYGPAGRRDPRGEVLTVAYAVVVDRQLVVTAADDAASVEWVPLTDALDADLAFDHSKILRDAVAQSAQRYPSLAK